MKYDITLKTLLMDGAPALLTQLAGTADVELEPRELPAVIVRRLDLAGMLPDDSLLHVEVQANNDRRINVRMLGYYWMLLDSNPGTGVVQVLLYIGDDPMDMPDGLEYCGLKLGYRLIDARTLDPAPLLASGSVSDIVASFLCRADNMEQRVHDILARLRNRCGGDETALSKAVSQLVLLADLRGAGPVMAKEIRDMPITIDTDKNPILHDIYMRGLTKGMEEGEAVGLAKGEAEGLAKGEVQGQARMLLRQIQRRFGPLPDEVAARVMAASTEELDAWADAVLTVDKLEAVFALRHDA